MPISVTSINPLAIETSWTPSREDRTHFAAAVKREVIAALAQEAGAVAAGAPAGATRGEVSAWLRSHDAPQS